MGKDSTQLHNEPDFTKYADVFGSSMKLCCQKVESHLLYFVSMAV